MKKKSTEQFNRGSKLLKEKRPDEYKNLMEGLAKTAPDVAEYVIGFVYGDIWSRKGLKLKSKALVTISALAAMGGVEPQLKSHIGGALKCGCSQKDIIETFMQIIPYAGFSRAINAIKAAQEVFAQTAKKPARQNKRKP